MQLDLFTHVANAYGQAPDGQLDNGSLYGEVARRAGLSASALNQRVPIGQDKALRSPVTRKIRWYQQTLKTLGLIEHVPGERGIWQLTEEGKKKLHKAKPQVALLAFSTDLGLAIWGSCEDVFSRLDTPIALCLSSPPYMLRRARAYGNPANSESEYVDFICRVLEPIVKNLMAGGVVCLNISNDIFLPGIPARSLYRERLVLALCDRLGLSKLDEVIWHNPSKPPSPIQWASIQRVQLNSAWEPVYLFTNDPRCARPDNRRVLEPHTERHLKLMQTGGENRRASFADGAYRIKPGDYAGVTPGRIPRNVLTRGHRCTDQEQYKIAARSLGLPVHGAVMPLSAARFFVDYLTLPDDLVVDPFGGSFTTAKAAELSGRRWLSTECMLEYARGAAERFHEASGFWLNPALANLHRRQPRAA